MQPRRDAGCGKKTIKGGNSSRELPVNQVTTTKLEMNANDDLRDMTLQELYERLRASQYRSSIAFNLLLAL
jgi:hypothetical protein